MQGPQEIMEETDGNLWEVIFLSRYGTGKKKKESLMHNINSHLCQRSFSSPLLNVHFMCSWMWQMTMEWRSEREKPTANSDRLWRMVLCYFCELPAVIEAGPVLLFEVCIALGFTPLRYVPPVHLTYPWFP